MALLRGARSSRVAKTIGRHFEDDKGMRELAPLRIHYLAFDFLHAYEEKHQVLISHYFIDNDQASGSVPRFISYIFIDSSRLLQVLHDTFN